MSAIAAPTPVAHGADAAPRVRYVLRLADASLILAQRLGEWIGHAPALEEDLGLANTALDLMGQARLLLAYAGELEARGRDEDALAFLREEREFLNPTLVEQPNGDFAHTIVRQFLVDAWQHELYARPRVLGRRAPRRDRRQGAEGDAISPVVQLGLGRPPGRRHGGEPRPHAGLRSMRSGRTRTSSSMRTSSTAR